MANGPWPVTYRRKIALTVDSAELALDVCAEGRLLAALPDAIVSARVDRGLCRLSVDAVRPVEIFVVRRVQLDLPGRAEALVDALRANCSAS